MIPQATVVTHKILVKFTFLCSFTNLNDYHLFCLFLTYIKAVVYIKKWFNYYIIILLLGEWWSFSSIIIQKILIPTINQYNYKDIQKVYIMQFFNSDRVIILNIYQNIFKILKQFINNINK